MRSTLPLFASGLILSLFTLTAAPMLAQTETACNFDLSDTTALLMQAQAKASSGDVTAGLALLDQAQQQLSGIQAECSENDAGSIPALTETYSPDSKSFTVKYPEGWLTTSAPASTTGEKTSPETVQFASSQDAKDVTRYNQTTDVLESVVVYVGTAKQIAIGLGAWSNQLTYDGLDAKGLMTTLIKGSIGVTYDSGIRFDDPQSVTFGDHEGLQAHIWQVSTDDPSFPKPMFDGALVIFPLSETQFAAVLGVITPENLGYTNRNKIGALALAVAATIEPA